MMMFLAEVFLAPRWAVIAGMVATVGLILFLIFGRRGK